MTQRQLIRFLAKIKRDKDCWLWTAAKDRTGYGRFYAMTAAGKRMQLPHRIAYEHFVGPIPEGNDIDHLCRQRSCVNPKHLEPVTRFENVRRGLRGVLRKLETHCIHGHPFDEQNTYVITQKNGLPQRQCRACKRDHMRRKRQHHYDTSSTATSAA